MRRKSKVRARLHVPTRRRSRTRTRSYVRARARRPTYGHVRVRVRVEYERRRSTRTHRVHAYADQSSIHTAIPARPRPILVSPIDPYVRDFYDVDLHVFEIIDASLTLTRLAIAQHGMPYKRARVIGCMPVRGWVETCIVHVAQVMVFCSCLFSSRTTKSLVDIAFSSRP